MCGIPAALISLIFGNVESIFYTVWFIESRYRRTTRNWYCFLWTCFSLMLTGKFYFNLSDLFKYITIQMCRRVRNRLRWLASFVIMCLYIIPFFYSRSRVQTINAPDLPHVGPRNLAIREDVHLWWLKTTSQWMNCTTFRKQKMLLAFSPVKYFWCIMMPI